jgi:hypothetical protein
VPAAEVPDTSKSQVVLQVETFGVSTFQYPTGNFDEDDNPEFVEVHDHPTVVDNKTVANKVIKSAADNGVKIAEVKAES